MNEQKRCVLKLEKHNNYYYECLPAFPRSCVGYNSRQIYIFLNPQIEYEGEACSQT